MADDFTAKLAELAIFLNDEGPKLAKKSVEFWTSHSAQLSPDDLKTLLERRVAPVSLREWMLSDVEEYVDTLLLSAWDQAYKKAGAISGFERFLERRHDALIDSMWRSQVRSLEAATRALVQAHQLPKDPPDQQMLREVYWLTEGDALAVVRYESKLLHKGLLKAALQYARKLLRLRAAKLSENELAEAHGAGSEAQAIEKYGSMNYKKTWKIDPDSNVCDRCLSMEDEVRAAGEEFSQGVQREPLHLQCRCRVEYSPI